jgi:hypothetical protein
VTAPTAPELRRLAELLGVVGWTDKAIDGWSPASETERDDLTCRHDETHIAVAKRLFGFSRWDLLDSEGGGDMLANYRGDYVPFDEVVALLGRAAASLMDESDRLAAMVPRWFDGTKEIPSDWTIIKTDAVGDLRVDGYFAYLAVPPIPLPAPSTNEPAAGG